MTTYSAKSLTGAFLIAALPALPAFAAADDRNNGRYASGGYSPSARNIVRIDIPKEDRFAPFAKEIHVGETVVWVNYDEDAHTVTIAPGPDGGIQDKNGNYGTPMMRVITVLPAKSRY